MAITLAAIVAGCYDFGSDETGIGREQTRRRRRLASGSILICLRDVVDRNSLWHFLFLVFRVVFRRRNCLQDCYLVLQGNRSYQRHLQVSVLGSGPLLRGNSQPLAVIVFHTPNFAAIQ